MTNVESQAIFDKNYIGKYDILGWKYRINNLG
jgi:hypothetical protein